MAAARVEFKLDLSQYEGTTGLASRARLALVRALNRTATQSRTPIVKQIAGDLKVTQRAVRQRINIDRASRVRYAAALYASAKRIPLIEFGARGPEPSRGRGRGVSSRLPAKRRLRHGFIATMASGHRGVFQRTPGKFMRRRPRRQAIREEFGPSIYFAFEKFATVAQARALEVLDKNVQHEFEFALSQK
jgi:hypothetical protein